MDDSAPLGIKSSRGVGVEQDYLVVGRITKRCDTLSMQALGQKIPPLKFDRPRPGAPGSCVDPTLNKTKTAAAALRLKRGRQ